MWEEIKELFVAVMSFIMAGAVSVFIIFVFVSLVVSIFEDSDEVKEAKNAAAIAKCQSFKDHAMRLSPSGKLLECYAGNIKFNVTSSK